MYAYFMQAWCDVHEWKLFSVFSQGLNAVATKFAYFWEISGAIDYTQDNVKPFDQVLVYVQNPSQSPEVMEQPPRSITI